MQSPADKLRALPKSERNAILASMGEDKAKALLHTWRFWARPEQLAPGTEGAALSRTDWAYWLLMAGRGFGKTRAGAEWAIEKAQENPGSHIALVGPTWGDMYKYMLSFGKEGVSEQSGIMAVSPPDFYPTLNQQKQTLTWPNGTVATMYTAQEPERLRGPQHHFAWVDEIAAWKRLVDAWDMLLMGLRLGDRPQACITTTPKPVTILRELYDDPATVRTTGTTDDNRQNLSKEWLARVKSRYQGTRFERQELGGELFFDNPKALWTSDVIERNRVSTHPQLFRIAIAIDPAVTSNERSDETGIVAGGVGANGHGYVLRDVSGKYKPHEWARIACDLYHELRADVIVGEVNNGGDLVDRNIQVEDSRVNFSQVRASRGKHKRAEPVSGLYEQNKIHHVGTFGKLEKQMTEWNPALGDKQKSPDRMDALVWLWTELLVDNTGPIEAPSLPDLKISSPVQGLY